MKLIFLVLIAITSISSFSDSTTFLYKEKFEAYDCKYITDVAVLDTSLSCGPSNENAQSSYCTGAYECKLRFLGDKEGNGKKTGVAFCKPNKNRTCPEPAECVTRKFDEKEVVAKIARVQTSEQALAEMKTSATHNSSGTPAVAQSSNPNHPDRK